MAGRTNIDIDDYTVYSDVNDTDDQFNLVQNAALLFLGDDSLSSDTFAGSGRVVFRGVVTVDDLSVDDGVTLVNTAMAVQSGPSVDDGVDLSQSAAVVRNVVSATWELLDNASITGSGAFVNLGLVELTSNQTASPDSVIGANFFDRGGKVEVQAGTLDFTGAITRFVNASITGAGNFSGDDVVLDGTSVSAADDNLQTARVVGDVSISGNFACKVLNLAPGSLLTMSNVSSSLDEIVGTGAINFRGSNSVPELTPVGSNIEVKGGVTLVNYGALLFHSTYIGHGITIPVSISLRPWAGKQIAIDNMQGATMTLQGGIQGPLDGSATLFNYGALTADGISQASLGILSLDPSNIGINVVNDGTINTTNGIDFSGAVTGSGSIQTGQGSTFEGLVESGQTVTFSPAYKTGGSVPVSPPNPTLTLDDVQQFFGVIAGFDQNGATDDQLVIHSPGWTYQDFVGDGAGAGGSLMFSDGAANAYVKLTGAYQASGFHAVVSGDYTTITYTG